MTMDMPRILVVSHNVFSGTGNMGRTLSDILSCVPPSKLAQIYFHSEIPTIPVCDSYFRITDKDVLVSIFSRKRSFAMFGKGDIFEGAPSSRVDKGFLSKVYQFARRRTPMIYFFRNTLWKLGKWKTAELDEWIENFNPEVLFFASGDYSFAYRITYEISLRWNLPIVMWCGDDFFLTKTKGGIVRRRNKRELLNWATRVVGRSSSIMAISDKMKKDYSTLFAREIGVLRISSCENRAKLSMGERVGIVYAGNLGVGRLDALLELGLAIKKAAIPGFEAIDVYSGDSNPEIPQRLCWENGFRFHGCISHDELIAVYGQTKFLLHVESSLESFKERTMYSLSTKVGDYLRSGACLLAYGPRELASMEYLAKNEAAMHSEKPDEIIDFIRGNDDSLYDLLVSNALNLAQECHSQKRNLELMRRVLVEAKEYQLDVSRGAKFDETSEA